MVWNFLAFLSGLVGLWLGVLVGIQNQDAGGWVILGTLIVCYVLICLGGRSARKPKKEED